MSDGRPEPVVIYHGGCFDGFTAAWIFSRYVNRDATFFGAKYGEAPPPVLAGQRVLILDFSYPRAVMERLYQETGGELEVLDHHKTAEANCAGLGYCHFDMTKCGCVLAWERFCRCEQPPLALDYIQDRDLWSQALPDTNAHAATVSATPMTFEDWDRLMVSAHDNIAQGHGIVRYIHQYGTKALAEMRYRNIGGGRWCSPAVNMPYMNCSEHVGRLLTETGSYMAVGYFQRGDGRWQFSLRSTPEFDCSRVAQAFGGGGHAQAAGFDVARLDEVFDDA